MEQDIETLKIQAEGEKILLFTQSEGWAWFKDRLTEQIMDLQSIMNVEGKTAEDVVTDIKARRTAIEVIRNVIRMVEGKAEQHAGNKKLAQTPNEDVMGYIE